MGRVGRVYKERVNVCVSGWMGDWLGDLSMYLNRPLLRWALGFVHRG